MYVYLSINQSIDRRMDKQCNTVYVWVNTSHFAGLNRLWKFLPFLEGKIVSTLDKEISVGFVLWWDLNKIKIRLLLLLWCVFQCLRLVTLDRCSRGEVLLVLARIVGTAVDFGRFYRGQVAGGALWRGLGRGMCRRWMHCCCVSDEEPR